MKNEREEREEHFAPKTAHFAQHFNKGDSVPRSEVRKVLDVEFLWQGKPISCMKTFGKNTCSLCMRERCCILDACNENPKKLINSKSEIYGGCRHRTRFHRLVRNNTTSTDDGAKPEKVSASTTATTIANKLSKAAGRMCHAAGTVVGLGKRSYSSMTCINRINEKI